MTAAGTICLAIALLAIAATVDFEMLSGAPKSLRFRLEYWIATAGMIRDHPWLGCGPGQFQEYYTEYKLPQASETVADPHNFLLEIWATAGWPTAVVYVFALGAFLVTAICREPENSVTAASNSASPFDVRSQWIYFGGLAGVALAWVGGLVVGFPPDLAIIFVGLPVATFVIWGLDPWVQGGRLPVLAIAVAWLVMLVNLMAAGGISFPGVAGSLYVLMAIGLNLVGRRDITWGSFPNLPKQLAPNRQVGKPAPRISAAAMPRWSMAVLAVLATAALAVCYFTMYGPVLNSRGPFARGQQEHFAARQAIAASRPQVAQSHLQRAALAFNEAATLDPWSPQPWFQQAGALHDSWQFSGDSETWQAFEQAVQQSLFLQPRSFTAQMRVGHWYLLAYRRSNRSSDLERALRAFSRAVELYPNDSYARCQLAWAHHLRGEHEAAARQARWALELDDLTPHAERKLRKENGRPGTTRSWIRPGGCA